MTQSILIDKNSIVSIRLFNKKHAYWVKYSKYEPKKTILFGLITKKEEIKEGFWTKNKFIEDINSFINEHEHLNLLLEDNTVFEKPHLTFNETGNNHIRKYFNTYKEMLDYVDELNLHKNFILIEDI